MNDIIFVNGKEIYKAAIAGAKEGFNRTTSDFKQYEAMLETSFRYWLKDAGPGCFMQIMRSTKGDWRNSLLPLCFCKAHKHMADGSNTSHVRVYMADQPHAVFDIKMGDWDRLVSRHMKQAA